jgi:hypothetical protein
VKCGVFWDVAPCSQVEVDRRFRGAYCLHHQGDATCMKHLHVPTCILFSWLKSFFYTHISERDEQNILKLEFTLFRLKHNVSTKQLAGDLFIEM